MKVFQHCLRLDADDLSELCDVAEELGLDKSVTLRLLVRQKHRALGLDARRPPAKKRRPVAG